MTPIHLTPAAARRYLALHHRLAPPRSLPPEKASVMALADHLGSFQFDPLDIAGRPLRAQIGMMALGVRPNPAR